MSADALPELASVYWRPRVDESRIARAERVWCLYTVAHVVPLVAVAAGMMVLSPYAAPVSLAALVQAWMIPKLYAGRGANVVRPKSTGEPAAQTRALGFLGDLVDHGAREVHARTGLVPEPGAFGTWLVGEAGAILVRPGGRRVHCYCVKASDASLPPADRIAHLLLALRADEAGFATIANRAFAGARWRLRRRLPAQMRPALDETARRMRAGGGRSTACRAA
jgi:hypothetical protein